MATIFYVMKEEYRRLLDAEQLYTVKIKGFPKGRPRMKRIHGIAYLYLNRRQGPKIVDEYVGRADSPKARQMIDLIEKRDRFVALRKQVREQIKEVKKVLRGKI